MDIDLEFTPIPLPQIAEALDGVPGPEGSGLSQKARAALFAYLEEPAKAAWFAIHNTHVTRRHTLRVAVMRHCHIGLYVEPTSRQVLDTLNAAAAGTLRP
jgi:hypothetical protein